jgi:hypothetical protein
MISIARIFGAPVTLPQGNSAASAPAGSRPGGKVAGDGRGHLVDRRVMFDA